MGAVNYYTSNYITLGIKPTDAWDLLHDADFMQFCAEEYPEEEPEKIAEEQAQLYAEADRENAEEIMSKYSFYYWHVVFKSGYYEGFSLDIEANFPIFFDDCHERKEALQEIADLEKLMQELAGVGLVSCHPSWCTSYSDYKGTLQDIKKACREMRQETKATPTWRTYNRETA